MNSHDDSNAYRQVKPNNYQRWAVGAGALLLAILLGFGDAAVLSGMRSSYSVSDLAVPMRIAMLLTIAAVLLVAGAVASFVSALRQNALAGGETEGQDEALESPVAEEIDVFNVRKAA